MTPEHCPSCRGRLAFLTSVYPVWVCEMCGTVLHGYEDTPTVRVPRIVSAMADFRGQCLRDDRGECLVYLTAKHYAEAK